MKMNRMSVALGLSAIMILGSARVSSSADGESSKDVIAAHIRTQGFVCDTPSSAVRDTAASKPNEVVWMLTCEDASYRVRLVPDMAAQVERLPAAGAAPGADKAAQP